MSRSDEAHFWLNGYVNKQNCRIWSEANPQVYVETPLHPEKLTVWCALWAGGIIGPYFFKNDEGHNLITSNCKSLKEVISFGLKEAGWANRRIARHMGRSNAAIRRCSKNGWTLADFSVMKVAFDLESQQIGRTDLLS
ncbi:hypothetical protein TNCV_2561051 [Trichonephila clavipes]|uniref:Uncharacterized protein n=1 Tax=Trichonephila clavipes TaxID=2585209 RepID=A0A8X6UWI4_TRICX|nr:hypothetical protein TNCV_2561051 [Trichonephila clavipes]